ncbi:MAG: bifunctional aspartate kinase/homoserine dehydrogenase I, partial [Bacteroidetes bacterium]|nr:bifunctional aspartate kinase/homoserine dehydrogenase I [Bacteroidota bacterium]
IITVVSAMSGITDLLIDAATFAASQNEQYKEKLKTVESEHLKLVRELIPMAEQSAVLSRVKNMCNEMENLCEGIFLIAELSARAKDRIVSYGELLSSIILSAKLESLNLAHEWVDSRRVIRTNSNFGLGEINFTETNNLILQLINNSKKQLYVMPGFIASNEAGATTTLGRGGSDFTAAIVAAAVNAAVLKIYTDVSGIMTADPRMVANCKVIPHISYKEAMELSHFGAKVIYPPTIQPVMKKKIPTWIKNTFAPLDYGTLIDYNVVETQNVVCGLSSIGNIAILSLEGPGMVGVYGTSMRLFGTLSKEKINVILITQASSEHSVCVVIDENLSKAAKIAIDNEFALEIAAGKIDPLIVENQHSIIALVGENMKNLPGISGKMFGALGRNGVNIRAIAQGSSEKNISAVISTVDVKKAMNVLHEDFFEDACKQINLFVAGVGNVGSHLLNQIHQQQKYLKEEMHLQINVIGISNSKQMAFNENGIALNNWKDELKNGVGMNLSKFISFIQDKNLRNSVFVDATASKEIAGCYDSFLKKSISVVACNKIACSSNYKNYKSLKQLARKFNASFLFETNVGAGLPVIGTLNDLMRSGDKVNKVEAVLSGTLNFVFNNYNASKTFASIVKQARDEGYAEPDPRIDLSGTDVMRKILILAREIGLVMEMEDIENNAFVPESSMKGSVDEFYVDILKNESHFQNLYQKAEQKETRLKFVAKLENGKASVGLEEIGKEHNLYHLYGKDNVVLFYTNRYVDQPLVIKGAGAGADVTASGIFADILRTVNV